MAGFAVDCLREAGLRPTPAWYRSFTEAPELSVSILGRRGTSVGGRTAEAFGGLSCWEMGAFLPELEFNQYRLSEPWRRLIDQSDALLAVSGSCLAAQPFLEAERRFVAWVATPWRDDRREREKAFSTPRRIVDALVIRPTAQRLEAGIVKSGDVLPLSLYTRDRLAAATGVLLKGRVLPMPIETGRFRPDPRSVKPGLVAFVGRLDDPRKRVDLLLEALSRCRRGGVPVEGLLVGAENPVHFVSRVAAEGLESHVKVMPRVPNSEIPSLLREVDVFVIPSDQEGLCIAGLEAMAAGCPVVSTRCGGPEEFVIEGQTGALVGHDSEELAEAIRRIVTDRAYRARLGARARAMVEESYSPARAREVLLEAIESLSGRRA